MYCVNTAGNDFENIRKKEIYYETWNCYYETDFINAHISC